MISQKIKSTTSQVVVALADALTEDDLAGLLAEVLEELSDLVGVHAGGGDLDRAGPVKVVVAQVEGQLLYHRLGHRAVVVRHVEVRRQHTALGCRLRHQVEVILTLAVLVLDDLSVNEAP